MKIITLSLALVLGCSSSKKDGAERGSNELPVPTKLPPASGSAAQGAHAKSIDQSYSSVRAMYEAPDGATPCESLFNAITAEQEAAKGTKRGSIFSFVAPKDELLRLCAALPAEGQRCLVPAYQARNQATCLSAKPPSEQVDKLYVLRKDLDQVTDEEPAPTP